MLTFTACLITLKKIGNPFSNLHLRFPDNSLFLIRGAWNHKTEILILKIKCLAMIFSTFYFLSDSNNKKYIPTKQLFLEKKYYLCRI